MEKIKHQKHSKQAYYLLASSLFERAIYYGVRTLFMLYILRETSSLHQNEWFQALTWLAVSILIVSIIGAFLGDFLWGNKKSIYIGIGLQSLGLATLVFPSKTTFYIGTLLYILGNGLYNPNLKAHFGKLYFFKTRLLDSAFLMLFLAANIGGFLGSTLIFYVLDLFDFKIAFICLAVLSLISAIPIRATREISIQSQPPKAINFNKKVWTILFIGFFALISSFIFSVSDNLSYTFRTSLLEIAQLPNSDLWIQGINLFFFFPSFLIAIVVWTKYYSSPLFKLLLAYIFGAIGLGIIVLNGNLSPEIQAITLIFAFYFLSLAEVHSLPVLFTVLVRYGSPKFLTVLLSLASAGITLFLFLGNYLYITFANKPIEFMTYLSLSMLGFFVLLLILIWAKPKNHLSY